MNKTRSIFFIFFLLLSFSVLGNAATTYHIGGGNPPNYNTLEDLRKDIVAGTVQFVSGDKVALYVNDNSLTAPLQINISGEVEFYSVNQPVTITGTNLPTSHSSGILNFNNSSGSQFGNIRFTNINTETTSHINVTDKPTIYVDNSNLSITNSRFSNIFDGFFNSPTVLDGVALSHNSADNLTINDSLFFGNSVLIMGKEDSVKGGAIYASDIENIDINNTNFIYNDLNVSTKDTPVNSFGGALALINSDASISNSAFINNSATTGSAIYFSEGSDLTLNNVTFNNNYSAEGAIVFEKTSEGYSTLNVNISQNNSNPTGYIRWKNYFPDGITNKSLVPRDPGLFFSAADENSYLSLNVDVAANSFFDMQSAIVSEGAGNLDIYKTGLGTWKYGDASNFDTNNSTSTFGTGKTKFNILEGTFYLASNTHIQMDGEESSFNLASGTTLMLDFLGNNPWAKITATGSFGAGENTKLHLKDVSYWQGSYYISDFITAKTFDIDYHFRIDNKYLKAYFNVLGEHADLAIEYVNDISAVEPGVNQAIDVFRKSHLPSPEFRQLFENIYHTGYIDPDILAGFRTLGGNFINNTEVALRSNWSNLSSKIKNRLSSFQMGLYDIDFSSASSSSPTALAAYYDYPVGYENAFTNRFWLDISKRWSVQDNVDGYTGYHYNPYGFSLGYDYTIDSLIVGLALSYDKADITSKSLESSLIENESSNVNLYGSWTSDNFYISGGLQSGFSWNKSHTNYAMLNDSSHGKYKAHLYGANLELGYFYDTDYFGELVRIVPYAGLDYARIKRRAFTEEGNHIFQRHFSAGTWSFYDLSVGLRTSKQFIPSDKYIVTPKLNISYVHTAGTKGPHSEASFAQSREHKWAIRNPTFSRDAMRLNLGLGVQINNRYDVELGYDLEWRRKYLENKFNLSFAVGF